MTHGSARPPNRSLVGLAASLAILILGPAAVLAHAALVTSDPANGTTLNAPPVTITATFAEAFDTKRSSMVLLGPDGATLATNQSPPEATAESLTISGFGTLPAGVYRVQWTTITPDDNGIERGTFSFTVAAAAVSPGAAVSTVPDPAATAASSPGAAGGAASGGAGDVVLPLVALVALLLVGLAWLRRRSR